MTWRSPAILLVLCVLFVPACAREEAAGCGGREVRLVTPGTLTIAADYSYPPFAFRSSKGDLVGFEIEIARAVAAEMKLEPTFLNRGAGSFVTGALAHRHDIAASGLRGTTDLREEACLSSPLFPADLGVLVMKSQIDEIDTVGDLDGKTVAILDNSEAERWALSALDSSTLASLPTADDLLTALQQGRADAVVADLPFVRFSAKESGAFAVAARVDTEGSYVFVGAPDNGPLMRRVDDALGRLRKNGRMGKIEKKWFG